MGAPSKHSYVHIMGKFKIIPFGPSVVHYALIGSKWRWICKRSPNTTLAFVPSCNTRIHVSHLTSILFWSCNIGKTTIKTISTSKPYMQYPHESAGKCFNHGLTYPFEKQIFFQYPHLISFDIVLLIVKGLVGMMTRQVSALK